MKTQKTYKISYTSYLRIPIILSLLFLNLHCEQEVVEWETKTTEMVITDYVYSLPENFTEFSAVLEYTGIENLLRVRGPFTLLLPTDEAMQQYYADMNVTSYTQIDSSILSALVYNHIIEGEVTTSVIGIGTLPAENGLGDYIASDLPGKDILLNKTATIIKRDIPTDNGYVQHIDKVLPPLTESIFDVLSNYDGFSIFLEGLVRTSLADTLKEITFPYGNTVARNRYTLLAVPDSLYNRMGISTVDDLIDMYSDTEDLTNINNGFYRYMEYHCLSGTWYFSDLTTGEGGDIYYLINNNNYLNIRVGDDFMINETDSSYTGFYYDLSNIPAKNGAIHTINSLLPYTEAAPTEVVFQTTDYFDLQQGSYYKDHYQRFYDGENTFEYIKWDAEFMQYYLKTNHYLIDDDCLNVTGHFWIEITTPKIRAGKYELSTFMFFGDFAITAWYFDDVYMGQVDPNEGTWGGDPLVVGEVEFETTTRHRIRLESVAPGGLFWDRVIFTPINQ